LIVFVLKLFARITGSGLFTRQGSLWYLRGVISASFLDNGQCDVSKYTIYTNTAMFSDWVNGIVQRTLRENPSNPISEPKQQQNENSVNLFCTYLTLEFEPTRIIKGEEAVIPRLD
jgi:hypothetical protein